MECVGWSVDGLPTASLVYDVQASQPANLKKAGGYIRDAGGGEVITGDR